MRHPAILALCFFVACASSRANRLREAMSAALDHLDPRHAAVLVANDAALAWAQDVVGPRREVVAVSRFQREHPGEYVPFNIAVQSAEAQRDGSYIVRLHHMAISHPPPDVPACGTGFELAVRRVHGAWTVGRKSMTVC